MAMFPTYTVPNPGVLVAQDGGSVKIILYLIFSI